MYNLPLETLNEGATAYLPDSLIVQNNSGTNNVMSIFIRHGWQHNTTHSITVSHIKTQYIYDYVKSFTTWRMQLIVVIKVKC